MDLTTLENNMIFQVTIQHEETVANFKQRAREFGLDTFTLDLDKHSVTIMVEGDFWNVRLFKSEQLQRTNVEVA